jgi:hypothetical protein
MRMVKEKLGSQIQNLYSSAKNKSPNKSSPEKAKDEVPQESEEKETFPNESDMTKTQVD